MIKVSIQKNGEETNGGIFPDQTAVDLWIAKCTANNLWGKNARQIASSDPSIANEDISKATSQSSSVDGQGNTVITYSFDADYVIVQGDITLQAVFDSKKQLGLTKQDFGHALVATVYAINDTGGVADDAFEAMLADTFLAKIERCCMNGSIKHVRAYIATYSGVLFTSDQKTELLAIIDASGLAV